MEHAFTICGTFTSVVKAVSLVKRRGCQDLGSYS